MIIKGLSMSLRQLKIDNKWTLFLDRDGVINEKIENDYVRNYSQFHLLPDVLKALNGISGIFGKIIIVTNQRGVAKGLMSISDVDSIHKNLIEKVDNAGGRIDRIYICPHNYLDNCNCRKPKTGMAEMAKTDFPGINFKKSIMVGDSETDIIFGRKAGMRTVMISKNEINSSVKDGVVFFKSLYDFYLSLM